MSEINLDGLGGLSSLPAGWSSQPAPVQGGGTWLSDLWGGASDLLSDGLNIASELVDIRGRWDALDMRNDAAAYSAQFQPQDGQAQANTNTALAANGSAQWVSGVPNGVVIGGGALLLVGLLLMGKR